MANVSISGLPEQTGKTDNDVLAIVDSGSTTTSKIKVSTLLSGVGGVFITADGTNNVVPDYYAPSAIDISVSKSAIVGGDDTTNSIAQIRGFIGGGHANSLTTTIRTDSGIVAGQNNTISSSKSFIGGGINHIIGGQGENAIIGGIACDAVSRYCAIAGADDSNTTGSGILSFIGGGGQHVLTKSYAAIIGGNSNTCSHDNSVILGGTSQSTLQNGEVVVPKLRTTQYASLNFPDDATAAANGVQLGEFYHNAGVVRIRIV